MKLWLDDVREAPKGWTWCKSVNEAKSVYLECSLHITDISLDHDAGDYAKSGGDYIKLLDWLDCIYNTNSNSKDWHIDEINFSIHSMNPVGKENMLRIINKNKWKYVEE